MLNLVLSKRKDRGRGEGGGSRGGREGEDLKGVGGWVVGIL